MKIDRNSKMKKWIRNISLLVLLCSGISGANGQGLTLNVDYDGGVNPVPTNGFFGLDVSKFLSNGEYVMELDVPSLVTWEGEVILADNADDITIGNISNTTSNNVTTYTVPFTLLFDDAGRLSGNVSMVFNDLFNGIPAICTEDLASLLNLRIYQNSAQFDQTNTSLLTQQKDGEVPQIRLTTYQGQEVGFDESQPFPYYVDVHVRKLREGELYQTPEVVLEYPENKLELVQAVEFRHNGYGSSRRDPFHENLLTSNDYVNDAVNGEINIKTATNTDRTQINPTTFDNYRFNYTFLRFYFKVTTPSLTSGEVKVTQSNATYYDCDGLLTTIPSSTSTLATFNSQTTSQPLFASFEQLNDAFADCQLACNSSIPSATFHFEANSIYTTHAGYVPVIKLTSIPSKINLSSIRSTNSDANISFKYTTVGDATLKDLGTGTGTHSFTEQNIEHLYIYNYQPTASSDFASDFDLVYQLKSTTDTYDNSDVFVLQYENYANTKTYSSTAIRVNGTCNTQLRLQDWYENVNGTSFEKFEEYAPGTNHIVRVAISPLYTGLAVKYELQQFKYKFNHNMVVQMDNSTHIVRFSETGQSSDYNVVLPSGSNGEYFKGIKVEKDPTDESAVLISFVLDNTIDCNSSARMLYLYLPAYVIDEASASHTNYESTYEDPNNLVTSYSFDIAEWNVIQGQTDNVSADIEVLCAGDNQAHTNFEKGTNVKMEYVVNNGNQNAISDLKIRIPVETFFEMPTGDISNYLSVKTKVLGELAFEEVFNANYSVGSDFISLSTQADFILRGNDKFYIQVDFKLKESLNVGQSLNDLSFIVDEFESIKGIKRFIVKPDENKLGQINIVESSDCRETPACESCVTSFSPEPGQEYLLSAWVKEGYEAGTLIPNTYVNAGIQISFNDGDIDDLPLFKAAGPIIEGWQRIEMAFVVPDGAYNINIELVNNSNGNDAFFDDIRIHPFRSNMKSYVYDPSTQRLTAELDENNYATYYEYDDEGNLIRVKKETERGVMTIQETRINQSKINK